MQKPIRSSASPAPFLLVCGRVCPQETQCEGVCIRGVKGEAVSIGKLERFVADWAKETALSRKLLPRRTAIRSR